MAARKRRPQTVNASDQLLTLKDVAQYLQVAERTVYLWAQNGQIPSFKLGNVWRFKQADLARWIEESRAATPRKSG